MVENINKILSAFGCDPNRIAVYEVPLTETCMMYGISTHIRVASFLAQIYHESALRLNPVENLNYSADRLLEVFGKYFTPAQSAQYARQPERIANRVYANRMGNGDELSGDGWKYRGRGLIQITGKENYRNCGAALGVNLIDLPDKLLEPNYAVMSAGWFWVINVCN